MFKRIMVGIDGSLATVAALAEAIRLAGAERASIRAVSIVERVPNIIGPGPGFVDTAALAQSLRDAAQVALGRAQDLFILTGLAGETALVDAGDGDVASVLLRESHAWGADLVVLGTHARRGIERVLLGSTAESFLRISTIPVLLIPQREHTGERTMNK